MDNYRTVPVLLLLVVLTGVCAVDACTGIRISTTNGDIFRGRTMEFAVPLPSDVIVIPRGWDFTGTTVSGGEGLEWTSELAAVGVNGFGLPLLADGVNEDGLSAALFYFANYVGYQEEPYDKSSVLGPHQLVTWILTSFSSVEEVRESIDRVVVPAVSVPAFGSVPPLHYIVMDRSGDCMVIEHINGELVVYDNPLGVITNSPSFDWHITNLDSYVNLSPMNAPPFEMDGIEIRELGMGSGLLGIPGDFTPPSRFVQAVFFSKSAVPVEDCDDAVLQVFHILNQFDIPPGSSRVTWDESGDDFVFDQTLWSSVSDLSRCRYYFRTHDNGRIRMVDLEALDPTADVILSYTMSGGEEILDLTENPEILNVE